MARRGRSIATMLCAGIAFVALSHQGAAAQNDEDPPALLLIMDSSGSMRADDGTGRPKIQAAKAALRRLIAQLPEDSNVGLRVYGHRIPNTDKRRGCKDTELVVPVGPLDRGRLNSAVSSFEAKGWTPIGLSLRQGARDLPSEGNRTIILVSDGIDTCAPPPPCIVARRLTQQGIDVTIETVGFQVDPQARRELKCIARATGGSYRDAPNSASLARGLQVISRRSLRTYQSPGEAIVGGAAYAEAPLLEPGLYSDTILSNESLWYAIELGEGQELVVKATLDRMLKSFSIGGVFEVQIVSPDLEDLCCNAERGYQVNLENRVVSVGARSGVVGGDEALTDDPLPVGTYYVRVSCDSCTDARREQPLELNLEVLGSTSPSPSPSPAATTAPGTEPGDSENRPDAAAPTNSISGPLAAAIVGLGVLVVILTIAVVMLWRRGRPGS